MTWVMSICSLKGILLIFGVFLAWETRNVHYPALNDSKNIGLAVYNVFMFSCLALVVVFVVTYPPLEILVIRSIVLVGATSTICFLFVPKVRYFFSKYHYRCESSYCLVNLFAITILSFHPRKNSMQLATKGVWDQIQKSGLVFQHNCFRTFRSVSFLLILKSIFNQFS